MQVCGAIQGTVNQGQVPPKSSKNWARQPNTRVLQDLAARVLLFAGQKVPNIKRPRRALYPTPQLLPTECCKTKGI